MEFYIVASVLILLAIVVSTGKIDSLYCKKYGPGLKNGKFTWWREFNFNPRRIRPLSVVLLFIISLLILAIPLFNISELFISIAVLFVAAVFSVIAVLWALEKE